MRRPGRLYFSDRSRSIETFFYMYQKPIHEGLKGSQFAATCSRLAALGELLSVTRDCFHFLEIVAADPVAGVACVCRWCWYCWLA
jgi:hypothetical protein